MPNLITFPGHENLPWGDVFSWAVPSGDGGRGRGEGVVPFLSRLWPSGNSKVENSEKPGRIRVRALRTADRPWLFNSGDE
jgi:hypothetical protein